MKIKHSQATNHKDQHPQSHQPKIQIYLNHGVLLHWTTLLVHLMQHVNSAVTITWCLLLYQKIVS